MQLGLIGLGRMGGNMRERLRAAGFDVPVEEINLNPDLRWKRGVVGAFGRSLL